MPLEQIEFERVHGESCLEPALARLGEELPSVMQGKVDAERWSAFASRVNDILGELYAEMKPHMRYVGMAQLVAVLANCVAFVLFGTGLALVPDFVRWLLLGLTVFVPFSYLVYSALTKDSTRLQADAKAKAVEELRSECMHFGFGRSHLRLHEKGETKAQNNERQRRRAPRFSTAIWKDYTVAIVDPDTHKVQAPVQVAPVPAQTKPGEKGGPTTAGPGGDDLALQLGLITAAH